MLIEAPCRLGEQFEHTRTWGLRGPLYFVGLGLFVWHCNMDGVTLNGSQVPYSDNRTDFYSREYLVEHKIAFEIPDRMLINDAGVPLRELGIDADGIGWLGGLTLYKDGGWHYRISRGRDGESRMVRTDVLDRLFDLILPAVRFQLHDYL